MTGGLGAILAALDGARKPEPWPLGSLAAKRARDEQAPTTTWQEDCQRADDEAQHATEDRLLERVANRLLREEAIEKAEAGRAEQALAEEILGTDLADRLLRRDGIRDRLRKSREQI